MKKPKISVVMAVYNGEKFLHSSINSILNQTFKDFEFIIINDGSTDNSLKILNKYARQDNRIRIINQENKGLTKSLNIGIGLAEGCFIARQDADDVSLPDRFKQQIDFLIKHPETIVIGSKAKLVFSQNLDTIITDSIAPNEFEYVNISMENPVPHSSVLFRKDIFQKSGEYDESFRFSQDFDLWNRMAKFGKIAILNRECVIRRTDIESISRKYLFSQMACAAKIRWKYRKRSFPAAFFIIIWYGIRHFIISLLPDKAVFYIYQHFRN